MRAKQFCVLTRTELMSMALLLIYCFMYLPLLVGVLCWSLFCYLLLCVLTIFAIILTRKRELVVLLYCIRRLVTVSVFGSSSRSRR